MHTAPGALSSAPTSHSRPPRPALAHLRSLPTSLFAQPRPRSPITRLTTHADLPSLHRPDSEPLRNRFDSHRLPNPPLTSAWHQRPRLAASTRLRTAHVTPAQATPRLTPTG